MKKIIFILFFLFIVFDSFTSEIKKFNFNGHNIKFINFKNKNIMISANCVSKNFIKKCKASNALKSANMKFIKSNSFGNNPGAVVCKEQFKAEVTLTRDKKGNEYSFCKFKDNSYLSTGTLGFYASVNFKKK